jgi:hypothetical protein
MEALLILIILAAAALTGFGIYFFMVVLSTLHVHRRAMHALHQELASRAVPRSHA